MVPQFHPVDQFVHRCRLSSQESFSRRTLPPHPVERKPALPVPSRRLNLPLPSRPAVKSALIAPSLRKIRPTMPSCPAVAVIAGPSRYRDKHVFSPSFLLVHSRQEITNCASRRALDMSTLSWELMYYPRDVIFPSGLCFPTGRRVSRRWTCCRRWRGFEVASLNLASSVLSYLSERHRAFTPF